MMPTVLNLLILGIVAFGLFGGMFRIDFARVFPYDLAEASERNIRPDLAKFTARMYWCLAGCFGSLALIAVCLVWGFAIIIGDVLAALP